MTKVRLTNKNVLTLPGGDRETNYLDTEFPGLRLRITPNGARSYSLRYSHNGKQRRKDFGDVRLKDVAEVRIQARDFKAEVEAGITSKAKEEQTWTIKQLAAKYFEQKEREIDRGQLKSGTLAHYHQSAQDFIFPNIGNHLVTEVRRAEVKDILTKVHKVRRRKNGKPEEVTLTGTNHNRCLGVMSGMFQPCC